MKTAGAHTETVPARRALKTLPAVILAVCAACCFHAAFLVPALCWLIVGFLACVFALRHVSTPRRAFYISLALGVACYAPHMGFLWKIFGPAAIPLWLILPFFLAVFELILWHAERRFGPVCCACLAPVLWTGIEYFRCEVWWLRFSWLSTGSTAHFGPWMMNIYGVFGAGFIAASVAVFLTIGVEVQHLRRSIFRVAYVSLFAGVVLWVFADAVYLQGRVRLHIAGLQLEFPSDPDLIAGLEHIRKARPETELIVLPEYTFDGPPPKAIRDWCRTHGKWLIAGGKEDVVTDAPAKTPPVHALANPFRKNGGNNPFRNTAFVISTNGEIVFKQAKSQPIQFFNDGLPAESQHVWESPWGKIGIAICYDASYRKVTDELIRQGAGALIFPTMDVEEWGAYEHELNARQARLRASEYRVSVLRVASSGPSELIRPGGYVVTRTEVPAQGAFVAGEFPILHRKSGRPLDTWLAPACTWATGGIILALLFKGRRKGVKADSNGAVDSPDSAPHAEPVSSS